MLCMAITLWVTWISNVCSNDHAFFLNFFPSLQLYWKHIRTYKVFNSSPSSSFNFWLRDCDTRLWHWPWQVCEDLQGPGGCLLLVSILPLRCPVPWQCQATQFSESLAEMTQHRASFQLLKVTQFSECLPHPPSFGKCWGGYAVESEVVLRITAAQPSDICNQFFTSEKIPSLFLHYTSAFSLSEHLLISSFGCLHAYMSDLYYPFVWIVSASEQQSCLHLCLDKKFTG